MKKVLLLLITLLFISKGYSQQQETITIYVNKNLWNSSGVSDAINTLSRNLTLWGNITVAGINTQFDATTSIQTFRAALVSDRNNNGINGAMIIGDLPIAWFEFQNDYNQYGYADFPTDLYFMDLTNNISNWLDTAKAGAWSGNAQTGVYDGYVGTPHADIWISRIVPSVLTGLSTNEVSILQDYCNKVNDRLMGNDNIPTTGVAIGNINDWPTFATDMFQNLGYPSISITAYTRPDDTRQNWMNSLQGGVEYANVFEHASMTYQDFTGGGFSSSDYCSLNPVSNVRFYNLFDCSTSRYTTIDNLGGLYSLGQNGLVTVGTTKTGSMLNFFDYNQPLSYNTTFGRAYSQWMGDYGVYNLTWHGGMSLQGCGALRLVKYPTYMQRPSYLSATSISGSQIDLTWTDNSTNEDGFDIERADSASGPWVKIGSVASNITTYSNTGLQSGMSYWYRVKAYNFIGYSGYSEIAMSTTQTVEYLITASSGSNGSITPSGYVKVLNGSSQGFTFTPNSGYKVNSVTVDGVNMGALKLYTFSNITANHTINVDFTINQYTITASAGANGSISPSGSVMVSSGANQNFTFTPNSGYVVGAVTVDGSNMGAVTSYSFTNVISNHTISVTFTAQGSTKYEAENAALSGGANRNTNHGGYSGTGFVDGFFNSTGALVSFTVNAASAGSYEVKLHYSAGNGASSNTGFYVNGTKLKNISCPATSNWDTWSDEIETVTLNAGNNTINYKADASSSACINLDYMTLTYKGATVQYTITASVGANGTISPSGSVKVNSGANQSFTITANSGYKVSSVTVDGANQGAITSYTFSNVTANHTISAIFESNPVQYTITASAGANGSINPSGSIKVNSGASQNFTIAANSGYKVSSVTVDGANQGAITSYTFNNVTANHTISATFESNSVQYTISASAGANGAINPSGSVKVNSGTNQAFTITPNSGYVVDVVTVDGASQGSITSYTFNNVTANHTISATFKASTVFPDPNKWYKIASRANTNQCLDVTGGSYANNTAIQFYTKSNVNQEFKFQSAGNGYYTITCRGNTGYSIDMSGNFANNQTLKLWNTQTTNANQKFKLVPISGGYYRIETSNAGFSIDNGGNTANGQKPKLWTSDSNNANQHWVITVVP